MKYTARYMHRRDREGNLDKFRIIHADTLSEAIKKAEQWTTKGYIMAGVTQNDVMHPIDRAILNAVEATTLRRKE